MAIDKVVDSSALDASLTAIANAIRAKTGKTATMTLTEMPTEIEGISGGGDTSAEDGIIDRTISGEYTNDRVTKVGPYVFQQCAKLTSVSFPNVTSIGGYAFYYCSSLTSADFPNVTSIGGYAFYYCSSLTSADFLNVTSIGGYAFYYCSSLTSADFPNVTSIGYEAFDSCYKLTTADFPLATSISGGAFFHCYELTTADFPLATSIGSGAFNGCFKLTTADFPLVTSIGGGAFYGCSKLTAIVLRATSTVCSLSNTNIFSSTPIASGTGYIYVPDALVDSYKSATNWSTYADQIKPLSEYTGG